MTNMDESYWKVEVSVSKSNRKSVVNTIGCIKGVISIIPTDTIKGKYYILCRSETFIHNQQAIDNVLFYLKEAVNNGHRVPNQ